MVTIKIKNCTLKKGSKWRANQNYTFTLWKQNGISDNPDLEEITQYINKNMGNIIILNNNSIIILI